LILQRACVKIRRSPWTTRQRRGLRRGPWRVSHGGGAPTDAKARGQLLQASGSSWTRRSTMCGTATRAAGTPTTARRRRVFFKIDPRGGKSIFRGGWGVTRLYKCIIRGGWEGDPPLKMNFERRSCYLLLQTLFLTAKSRGGYYPPLKITFCPSLKIFIAVVFTYVEEVVERSAAANIDFWHEND
jgi:hypothetical protein